MAIEINRYRNLSREEQQKVIKYLQEQRDEVQQSYKNAEKMCKSVMADEKSSPKDAAEIIRHANDCKSKLKDIEDDLDKTTAYTTQTTNDIVCDDRDPYVALSSILGNGFVNIRSADLCNQVPAGTTSFKEIKLNRKKEREIWERRKWAAHYVEYNRPTKKDDPAEQKDREQQKERDQQKAKGAQ